MHCIHPLVYPKLQLNISNLMYQRTLNPYFAFEICITCINILYKLGPNLQICLLSFARLHIPLNVFCLLTSFERIYFYILPDNDIVLRPLNYSNWLLFQFGFFCHHSVK